MKRKECHLCAAGFPLEGIDHYGTQSLGMIPTTRCRSQIKRGDVGRFRAWLNWQDAEGKHRHGKFRQRSRPYSDYLYAQDQDRFTMEMCNWLPNHPLNA